MGYLASPRLPRFDNIGWRTIAGTSLLVSCLYIIQPVIAMVVLVAFGLFVNRRFLVLLGTAILMVIFYLGMVNLHREPVSDLGVYLGMLDTARNSSLLQFYQLHEKEPGYYLFVYWLANVPGSSEALFIFTSTVVSYGLFIFAIARLCHYYGLPTHTILGLIVFFAFFPPLFNNSAHLMKQFMAGALIACFFASSIAGTRERWIVLLLAFLTHSSAIIFIPLAILGLVRKHNPAVLLSIVSLGLASLYVILMTAGHYLVDIPYLGPILQRAISGAYVEHARLGIAPLMLVAGVVVLSLYNLVRMTGDTGDGDQSGINGLCITALFLGLFIFYAHFVGETMLATRLVLYIYFLLGPLAVVTVKDLRPGKLVTCLSLILMPIYFGYVLVNGVWDYGAKVSLAQTLFLPTIFD